MVGTFMQTDYYTNVNKYPTKQELQNLVAQITVIPGCEDYNTDKAYAYFAGKRQQNGDTRAKIKKQGRAQQQPNQPQPPTSAEILYPTLVNEMSVLAKLDVLLTETPHPTDDVVKIWATRIGNGVWPEDIKTYAALKRARRPSEDAAVQPPRPHAMSTTASHLPTPESSISPEPHSTPTSPVVESSWGKVELEEDVKDQLVSDEEDEPSATLTQNEVQPGPQPIPGPSLTLIADELRKALYAPPEDSWTKPQMKNAWESRLRGNRYQVFLEDLRPLSAAGYQPETYVLDTTTHVLAGESAG
ncbi:hypothetical protein ONZ51_g63 [Trametes cubensis]|uniref:Uncharacterized protein n=1 Tax=Trametes cubensis TaxID=1111947 RepID=A0AAD7XH75_9APHY|nr:hypothetical protein ONZ51_g63 [Trametes cubensis]